MRSRVSSFFCSRRPRRSAPLRLARFITRIVHEHGEASDPCGASGHCSRSESSNLFPPVRRVQCPPIARQEEGDMSYRRHTALAAVLVLASTAALSAVTRIEITKREPFAGGQSFGDVRRLRERHRPLPRRARSGPPAQCGHRRPRQGAAQRARHGRILGRLLHPTPVDLGQGQRRAALRRQQSRQQAALAAVQHARAATTIRRPRRRRQRLPDAHGFTVVWSGWIPDALLGRRQPLLRIDVPTGRARGRSSRRCGTNSCSTTRSSRGAAHLSGDVDRTRRRPSSGARAQRDAPTVVPADQWEFVDDRRPSGCCRPARRSAIGAIYQFVYRPPIRR